MNIIAIVINIIWQNEYYCMQIIAAMSEYMVNTIYMRVIIRESIVSIWGSPASTQI